MVAARGRRRLDSFEVILRLAEVLQVHDLATFTDWPLRVDALDHGDGPTVRLRHAVIDHQVVDAFPAPGSGVEPDDGCVPTLAGLRAELTVTWDRWSRSPTRYTECIARVPRLLSTARSLTASSGCLLEARLLASGAYRLARVLLTRLGDHHLAWHCAYQALDLSDQAGHHVAGMASAWHVGACLFQLGQYAEAGRYALSAADRITDASSLDGLALWGALHLLAAESAAAALDGPEAENLLGVAQAAAESLGGNSGGYCVWFGPTEVAIVGVQIAMRLGRTNEALRIARETEIPESYPVGRQARHYIALAVAHGKRGEDAAAVQALTQAARACPQDLRYDTTARRTLQSLIRRNNQSLRTDLNRLALVAGIG